MLTMSFFYILCDDKRYPLWEYSIVDELSNRSNTVKHRFIKPAQIAITQSGLSYVTNQKDGMLAVFDCNTLSLKATHSLNSYTHGFTSPWMTTPTCISPDTTNPTCYIVPRNKPLENKKLCIVTPQENGKFISVSSADLGSSSPYTVCGGPTGNIYLGNAKEECLYTYNLNKGFVNTISVRCTPSALAYDKNRSRIHVCDSLTNTIRVFDARGRLCYEYGKKNLVMPQQLIISDEGFSYVVCTFNLRSFLALFDSSGNFVYSVHGFLAPSGVGIGPDGAVWVSDSKKHCIVRLPNLSAIRPPFPLPLLCYKTMLLHLNEVELSKLPSEYSRVLADWTQAVDILVRQNPDSPGTRIRLKLKHGLPIDIVKWILCRRLGISEKSLLVFREKDGGKHVQQLLYYMDHLVVDHLATPTTPPPSLNTNQPPFVK